MSNFGINFAGYGAVVADTIIARTIEATEQVLAPNGTEAAPGFAFKNSLGSGLFLTADSGGRVNLASSGVNRFWWDGAFNHSLSLLTGAGTIVAGALQSSGEFQVTNPVPVSYAPTAIQAITGVASAFGTPNRFLIFSSDGNYTLTSTPTLPDGTRNGQVCTLINVDSAEVVTVQDQGTLAGSNLRLGAATRAIGPRDSLRLVWLTAVGDWVELGFNTVI